MIRDLLMVARVSADGLVEAEPITLELDSDGLMVLHLDDGQRLEFDYDELLAIAAGDHALGAEGRVA